MEHHVSEEETLVSRIYLKWSLRWNEKSPDCRPPHAIVSSIFINHWRSVKPLLPLRHAPARRIDWRTIITPGDGFDDAHQRGRAERLF